jgi:drug/metabolite transporter (DMT)-like permease
MVTGTIQATSYGLVYTASKTLPSGLTALLWSSFPLVFASLAHFLLVNDRLRPDQWVGMMVGLLGVGLLLQVDIPDGASRSQMLTASGFLLLSPVVVSLSTILIKRFGSNCSSLQLSRNGICLAAVLLIAASSLTEVDEPRQLTAVAIASVIYLGVIGTAVSFAIYYWLLRYERATRLSIISYISPVIALFLGAILLNESITLMGLLGASVVLFGVWLAGRRPVMPPTLAGDDPDRISLTN